jgi:hypothetical protein
MLFDKCLISSSIGTEQRHSHRFPLLGQGPLNNKQVQASLGL